MRPSSPGRKGKKQPKTEQLHNLAGAGAMQGAFWGMLFGLIFFVPFFGLAVGAAMGALSGKFADYGIDDNFIKQMRDKVTEGTSALFLLTSGAVVDKIVEALEGPDVRDHFDEPAQRERRRTACGVRRRVEGHRFDTGNLVLQESASGVCLVKTSSIEAVRRPPCSGVLC